MKKILMGIIPLMIVINSAACAQKAQKTQKKEGTQGFDINIATNVLETYMGNLTSGDTESAKKFLSEKLTKKGINLYNTDLKTISYKTDEINEVGKSGMFRVKVVRGVSGKPTTVLDSYSIKVEMDKSDYKVTDINVT
ncbi:MAG: hypothetical protein Q8930_17625, partial [Bacillota bacterium]|nr:hypothetical protein [Bacillota bacterium]